MQDIYGYVPSREGNKNKNKLSGLHQNKKLLYNKGNHQQNKRQLTAWVKIFANDIFDKKLIFKIYKELLQLNTPKINNLILK